MNVVLLLGCGLLLIAAAGVNHLAMVSYIQNGPYQFVSPGKPEQSIVAYGEPMRLDAHATAATIYPGNGLKYSTGTYENGVALATDRGVIDGIAEIKKVNESYYSTGKMYDYSDNFLDNEEFEMRRLEVGCIYWLFIKDNTNITAHTDRIALDESNAGYFMKYAMGTSDAAEQCHMFKPLASKTADDDDLLPCEYLGFQEFVEPAA